MRQAVWCVVLGCLVLSAGEATAFTGRDYQRLSATERALYVAGAVEGWFAADKVLKAVLGDDKVKGWAKSLEFKKEAVYLLEDKAENAPAEPKDARLRSWAEAKTGWEKIAVPNG